MSLNRITPNLPADAFKTYSIQAPLATHWRSASCAEVDCTGFRDGWCSIVPSGSPQAAYIRADRSRRHIEEAQPGGLTCFTFEAGQKCFVPHKTRIDRPEHFRIRGGDWRGNPRGEYRELPPAAWVEDFGDHQEHLVDQYRKG